VTQADLEEAERLKNEELTENSEESSDVEETQEDSEE
jgi:hypothetical protein